VLMDLVNHQVEDLRHGIGLEGIDMVNPKSIAVPGTTFLYSQSCMLLCGEICKNDVVALSGKRLGRVLGFWAEQQPPPEGPVDRTSSIAVEMLLFSCASQDGNTWSTNGAEHAFAMAADLLAPVVWAHRQCGRIRAVLPRVWYSA